MATKLKLGGVLIGENFLYTDKLYIRTSEEIVGGFSRVGVDLSTGLPLLLDIASWPETVVTVKKIVISMFNTIEQANQYKSVVERALRQMVK